MKTWHTVIIQIKKYLYTRQRLKQMGGLKGGRGICCWSRTSACLFSLRVLSVSLSLYDIQSDVACSDFAIINWHFFGHGFTKFFAIGNWKCQFVPLSVRLSVLLSVRPSDYFSVDLSVCYFSLFLLLFVLLRFVWGTVCKFLVERDNNLGKKRKQRNFMWFKGKRD